MPKSLLARCRPDSIKEFRRAAVERYQDGIALALAGRRAGAIYLFGYAAEMTLKAAYFAVMGYADDQPITLADLKAARDLLKVAAPAAMWQGSLHNLLSWATLLIATRGAVGLGYGTPALGDAVLARATAVQRHWAETLRYHANRAYNYEARQVADAAGWLLARAKII